MNSGQMIFTQVMDVMSLKAFRRCVSRYQGDFSVKQFTCLEQFRVIVTRAESNFKFERIYSYPVDKDTGLICDQTIKLTVPATAKSYPGKLRRVKYRDPGTNKVLVFLTNNFDLTAKTVADLYKQRWQVELFSKWIKQNLRIKTFYGTSENAVKTQIWIVVSVYLMVAILKKRLKIEASLYTMLQILSVSVFKRT
jgi:IS4 transposase